MLMWWKHFKNNYLTNKYSYTLKVVMTKKPKKISSASVAHAQTSMKSEDSASKTLYATAASDH